MVTIKEYLDYAELAQAAYGNLSVGRPNVDELKNTDRAKFSQIQAENFAENYTVSAVSSPDSSGFSATLFEDKSGKKILSVRGTDDFNDLDDDLYDGLSAGKIPEQYTSLVSFIENLKSSGKISTADNFVVTGHSLGGALTQMITATYPDYVDEAYTYNSPGAKNLSVPPLVAENGKYYIRYVADELGSEISAELYNAYLSFDANKNSVGSKVVNVEAKDGPSVITDLGTDIGSNMEVFVNADGNYIYNHSSKTLTQTLAFYNTLVSLDSTLNIAQITQFLEQINSRGIIVKDKLELHQDLLNRIADILEIPKANTVFDLGENIVDTGAKHAIEFLTDKLPSQLQNTDKANLYALKHLLPFTIEGNLSAYDTINPGDYSEMYIADRAYYLYYTPKSAA